MQQYVVTGMSSAACEARVEKAVRKIAGVDSVSVSLLTNSMKVEGSADPAAVIRAVEKAGYGAEETGTETERKNKRIDYKAEEEALKDREIPRLRRRLFFSVGFLLVLMYITLGFNRWGWPLPSYLAQNYLVLTLVQMLLAAIVMLINRDYYVNGFRAALHSSANVDTLVALGSFVSFAWGVASFFWMLGLTTNVPVKPDASEMQGYIDYFAELDRTVRDSYMQLISFDSAAMIPALITAGKLLEAVSRGRTTSALRGLLNLAPETAVVILDGQETEVPADDVRVGDVFVVRPGDRIPADGVVLSGISAVDESALSGESIPADKSEGDTVSTGTINQSGYLTCRATRIGEDTTLAKIIQLVSDAAATRAPISRIADKVAGFFVPVVILIAVLVTVGWMVLDDRLLSYALPKGIAVLVVSCPCALGLATPAAIMVGNGVGVRNGILFKTGASLETAGKIGIAVLDKTGTITAGQPEVTDIIPAEGISRKELLEKAYTLEKKSDHPLARAVNALAESERLVPRETKEFTALPGNGLQATLDGKRIQGGNRAYIEGFAELPETLRTRAAELAAEGKTPLFFAEDGRMLGIIALADIIKNDSEEAVRQMHRLGIRLVMVTGDNRLTANTIGKKAGVDEVAAGVKPDEKEEIVRKLERFGRVAMIGDGINDAPALIRANTGIAIGAGTDVVIDSADVVLRNSTLADAAAAIRLSRRTLRIIRQNLFWAFFYNLICIPMAGGIFVKLFERIPDLYLILGPGVSAFLTNMNPMAAAIAMSLSTLTVCLNSLRLNRFKVHDASRDKPLHKDRLPARLLPERFTAAPEVKTMEKLPSGQPAARIGGPANGPSGATGSYQDSAKEFGKDDIEGIAAGTVGQD